MKACVLSDWGKLEVLDVPIPELSEDEVLVEVILGGVCGSDVTVTNHKHPTATVPRILCHEILGRVMEIRSDKPVTYQVGDRVVVFPLQYCGECIPCLTGHTSACSSLQIMGLHKDGGFAEYCKAPIGSIIPVPDEIPDEIAVLTEPLSVAFHANSQAGTRPGDKVLVIGGGPIGLLCAQAARYFGGKVLLSEINEERLMLAESMGIETINPVRCDLYSKTQEFTNGVGFDIVLEVTGSSSAYRSLAILCRECGTIVGVAVPSEPKAIQMNLFIMKELSLRGLRCCPKNEFERTVEMVHYMYKHKDEYHLENMVTDIFALDGCAEGIAGQEEGANNGKILIRMKE